MSSSSLQHKQCHVFYVGVTGGLYSGVKLIVRDSLQHIVVHVIPWGIKLLDLFKVVHVVL